MQLHTRMWGDAASNKTVVLIHGITSNAGSWVRVASLLAESGFRCVAPDLRGHGDSPKPSEGYSLAELVADLGESVPNEPDLLIGHSLGGLLAILATAEGALRPRHLVLEDPVLYFQTKETPERMLDVVESGPRDAESLHAANPRWERVDAEQRAAALMAIDFGHMRRIFAGNAPWDVRRHLEVIGRTVATLLLLPDASEFVLPRDAAGLGASLGPGAIVTVPRTSHNIHRDDLDAFLATLVTWYADAAPPAPHPVGIVANAPILR